MGKEEPESEDGFGKDIEDSVSDDLGVNVDVAGSISNTPDAMTCQTDFYRPRVGMQTYIG